MKHKLAENYERFFKKELINENSTLNEGRWIDEEEATEMFINNGGDVEEFSSISPANIQDPEVEKNKHLELFQSQGVDVTDRRPDPTGEYGFEYYLEEQLDEEVGTDPSSWDQIDGYGDIVKGEHFGPFFVAYTQFNSLVILKEENGTWVEVDSISV